MKKIKLLIVSSLLAVALFSFVACSSSPVVGEWTLVGIKSADYVYTIDEWFSMNDPVHYKSFEITLSINKDGTCDTTTISNGVEIQDTFPSFWKFKDNTLYLLRNENENISQAESTFIYEYAGEQLISLMYIFERKN